MATWMLFALLAVIADVQHCDAFSPNRLAKRAARAKSSMSHEDITKSAVLLVARSLLLDNPNHDAEHDSTAAINSLPASFGASALFAAYYAGSNRCPRSGRCKPVRRRYLKAVTNIARANANVDLKAEKHLAAAHFDSEQFHAGQARMLSLRRSAVRSIREGKYRRARQYAGRLLHTLQDFYSHSNWVELGKTSPYNVLGREGAQPGPVVAPDVPTCEDCNPGAEPGVYGLLAGFHGSTADREYECADNLRDFRASGALTSGYFAGGRINGADVVRPSEKCSHGGIGDLFSDGTPSGGINKDLNTNTWSPHFYLHEEAAGIATRATVELLQVIQAEVGDENFASFLNIEIEENNVTTTSIAYVIDTTGSMREELPEIQSMLDNIQRSLETFATSVSVLDLILVPYNDPGQYLIHNNNMHARQVYILVI